MEAAPSAKPSREPPPVPPNYVSLRQLQELRLKEKEEREKRQREAEEAAAAAKREAALKAEMKGCAASLVASSEAKQKSCGRQEQGHTHGPQWVAVAHRLPASIPRPRPSAHGEGAAGKKEAAIGGGRAEKGPGDVAADAHRGGGKPQRSKGKGKEKISVAMSAETRAVDELAKQAEAAAAPSHGGKLENKRERKAKEKASGDQSAESGSQGDSPVDPAVASSASSRGHSRRKGKKGPGVRSAGTSTGDSPVKTAGASPPQGTKPDSTGKTKALVLRRPGARPSSESSQVEKVAPAPAPATSAAEGSSAPTSGGDLRAATKLQSNGVLEGQRRRQVVEVQAAAERKARSVRSSVSPRLPNSRSNGAAEQRGRVWVPKAAAAGSSAGAGL